MDGRTQEILILFAESWEETEKRCDFLVDINPETPQLKVLRNFISKLKYEGGDNFFRLGMSMYDLWISRSINFGLRSDQKYIKIETFDNCFVATLRDGEKTYRQYRITDLEDVKLKKLLETLKNTLVD